VLGSDEFPLASRAGLGRKSEHFGFVSQKPETEREPFLLGTNYPHSFPISRVFVDRAVKTPYTPDSGWAAQRSSLWVPEISFELSTDDARWQLDRAPQGGEDVGNNVSWAAKPSEQVLRFPN